MDRLTQLQSYTVRELVDELKRRIAELDEARALLAGTEDGPKNSKMSQAKAEYWRDWRRYKAEHPDATVEQWRRAQKRNAKK
jgi:hypothetical protein